MRQDYPGIEILEMVENLDRDDVSFEVTLSLLERYPDLDGLCLMSAGIGGAGRAIKLAENGYGIKVVSFDFIPETVELVKEGIIDFTIGQNPFMQGYQPIKILSDYLLFDRVPQVDFYRISNEIKITKHRRAVCVELSCSLRSQRRALKRNSLCLCALLRARATNVETGIGGE